MPEAKEPLLAALEAVEAAVNIVAAADSHYLLEAIDTVRFCALDQMEKLLLYKPSWDRAPDWANYWAIDDYGFAAWYRLKPTVTKAGWSICREVSHLPDMQYHKNYGQARDFANSLRARVEP